MSPLDNPLPPRPNAIATVLRHEEDMDSVQTLLYTIRNTSLSKPFKSDYPPELVVFISSSLSKQSYIDRIPLFSHRTLCIEKKFLTVELFRLEEYDRILLVDAPHCLAFKELCSALHTKKDFCAVPDQKGSFRTEVLLLRPNMELYTRMKLHTIENESQFLRSFFENDWKQLPKPYFVQMDDVTETSEAILHQYSPNNTTWQRQFQKSETERSKLHKQKLEHDRIAQQKQKKVEEAVLRHVKAQKSKNQAQKQNQAKEDHVNISKRYKELRKQGLDAKEAMLKARMDCGQDVEQGDDRKGIGEKVARMFGMG